MNKGRVYSVGALMKYGSIYALSQTLTRFSHVVCGTDELWARALLTPLSSATQAALAEPEERTPLATWPLPVVAPLRGISRVLPALLTTGTVGSHSAPLCS